MREAVARGMRELVTWGVIPARNGKKTRNQQCVTPPPQQASPSSTPFCLTDLARQSPVSGTQTPPPSTFKPPNLCSTGRNKMGPKHTQILSTVSTTNPTDAMDCRHSGGKKLSQLERRKSCDRDVGGSKVSPSLCTGECGRGESNLGVLPSGGLLASCHVD